VAKRLLVLTYACVTCGTSSQAAQGTALAMLQICAGCQDKRVKAGEAARRKAGVAGG
jgi:hypothetical protein